MTSSIALVISSIRLPRRVTRPHVPARAVVALVALVGCTGDVEPAVPGFSLAEMHQLTSSFVTGCVVNHDWATRFSERRARTPIVRIRGVTNATGEDLDTGPITRIVADELGRGGWLEIAPSDRPADFLLTGQLSFGRDVVMEHPVTRGHLRYVGHLEVASIDDGRAVCKATGAVMRWLDE